LSDEAVPVSVTDATLVPESVLPHHVHAEDGGRRIRVRRICEVCRRDLPFSELLDEQAVPAMVFVLGSPMSRRVPWRSNTAGAVGADA
jgi:hypothetical protein